MDSDVDDEYPQKFDSTSFSYEEELRGLVGLQNLGNTCYMNGALQALSNCQQLTRFILDCPGFVKDTGLSRSYSELIKEIWSSKNPHYAVPTSIIRNIKCIYPAFRGCTQQDTQEFLRCFLEQLHDELKQASHTSIVSDTFEFKITSSVVCSNCNNISTTKETFKDLSIPIPSREHPYYNNECEQQSWFSQLYNLFWGPPVTLDDCLSIFFGTDPLEGDNEYSCEICTKKNRGVKYLKIFELPEVLCIHFKRYESVGSAKITTHVSFPLTGLDLSPFMSPECQPKCTTYNLIACICHHGSALLTGHYTTYALNCYDDQWYEFDDQYVSCVSSYQVENSEAYILFYQKSTMDDTRDRQRVKASKLLKQSLHNKNIDKYYISKQWVNKFNTFVEPGPITNSDFLCEHERVPASKLDKIGELCSPISESVWNYLTELHGGGPMCDELKPCDTCK